MRLALPPVTIPVVTGTQVSRCARHIAVTYAWRTGAGRHAAITRLMNWISGELGAAAQLQPGNAMAQLRGFLALRFVGVIPPVRLTSDEILLIIAKLAESQDHRPPSLGHYG